MFSIVTPLDSRKQILHRNSVDTTLQKHSVTTVPHGPAVTKAPAALGSAFERFLSAPQTMLACERSLIVYTSIYIPIYTTLIPQQ